MKKIDKNLALWDRLLRAAVAGGIMLIWFLGYIPADIAIGLLILAAALLVNSFMGICMLYSMFGISSCPIPDKKDK